MHKKILDELRKICPEVSRSFSISKEDTYITIQLISSRAIVHADDDFDRMRSRYRIHLFAKEGHVKLYKRIIKALKADAHDIFVEAELYENDTGYHHIPIYCEILEEI